MKTAGAITFIVGFAITLLLLCFVWAPSSAQVVLPLAPEMPDVVGEKWEYKIVTKSAVLLPREEADFNILGAERWELTGVAPRTKDGEPVVSFIFKRPKT